jgi:streptogramin lyase
MGLSEDAQQQRHQLDAAEARQRQQEDEPGIEPLTPRRREADAAAQQEAVGEFIAAMRQLGIAPQRHRWLEERLLFKPRLSIRGVRGWSVDSPRSRNDSGLVVTPNGDVYYMHIRRGNYRRPLDPPVYGYGGLVERLRDGIVRARQGH